MDKPLSDKKNNDNAAASEVNNLAQAQAQKAAPAFAAGPKIDFGTANIGAYSQDISKQSWDKAENDVGRPWADDPAKRLAIRTFSRGVLGAVFFTGAQLYARKALATYDVRKGFANTKGNPLQVIAKSIDTFIGKPISWTVHNLGGDGAKAVRFRPTNHSRGDDWGRSLGDEVVKVTFDFFMMSIGDAFGRDICALIDPNVRHSKDPNIRQSWLDEKGHVKAPEAVKSLMKTMWRYVSYNGGEDWAVALPYVYFMKAQRNVISTFSHGFRIDSDRAGNGAGFILKSTPLPDGKYRADVVGNFNKEGALDFQGRFTVYNIFTLMFREAYNYIGNTIKGAPDNLYGAPDAPKEHRSVVGKVGHLAKWFARSVVKGVITMTPAVPFFWITRVPQSAYKAAFIDPEMGHLSYHDPKKKHRGAVHADHIMLGDVDASTPELKLSRYTSKLRNEGLPPFKRVDFDGHSFEPLIQGKKYDPYAKSFGPIDSVFHAVGRANSRAAKSLDTLAGRADARWGNANAVKNMLGIQGKSFRNFSRTYVDAAISYTPYMYTKAEFGHLWDNGKTDLAAERMIDGAANLNWREFRAGLGEVTAAVLHEPFADPAREAEAQRRISIDTSAPETFDREMENIEERESRIAQARKLPQRLLGIKPAPDWRERVVTAAPKAKTEELPAKSENHTQRETLRKALEELQPPTNSIN